MLHTSTATALHKNIRKLPHRESFRFLLAVWPDTWWWFMRLQNRLEGLPCLHVEHPQTEEIYCLLERCSEHGTRLGNGQLREAVLSEIEDTARRLQQQPIICAASRDNVWDWMHTPFPEWRGTCPGGFLRGPGTAEKDEDQASAQVHAFIQQLLMQQPGHP
jgi:hypothetical protein